MLPAAMQKVRVGTKGPVPFFAVQHKRKPAVTQDGQRPANRGAAHAKQLCDPADCRKRAAGVARLLEQAQANAERSGSQLPAEHLPGYQRVISGHRNGTNIGRAGIAGAAGLLTVLIIAAAGNVAGGFQLLHRLADGGDAARGHFGKIRQCVALNTIAVVG